MLVDLTQPPDKVSEQSWTWVTFSWPDPTHHKLKKSDPAQSKGTVKPTDLYTYSLIKFTSATDRLNIKHLVVKV